MNTGGRGDFRLLYIKVQAAVKRREGMGVGYARPSEAVEGKSEEDCTLLTTLPVMDNDGALGIIISPPCQSTQEALYLSFRILSSVVNCRCSGTPHFVIVKFVCCSIKDLWLGLM